MMNPQRMVIESNKWCGSRNGVIPGSGNRVVSVPPACQIVNSSLTDTAPFGSTGDKPWFYCAASEYNEMYEKRKLLPGLAAYQPNRVVSFMLDVQPDALGPKPIRVDRTFEHPHPVNHHPYIYYFAKAEMDRRRDDPAFEWDESQVEPFFVKPPQAHCERLGFFSNVNRHDMNYLTRNVKNWAKPGGGQANTPPIDKENFLWSRILGSNLCMSLIRPSSHGEISVIPQDFQESILEQRGPPFFEGEWNFSTPFPNTPGRNPFSGCEYFAGWSPSLLNRDGDIIPSSPGESVLGVVDRDDYYVRNAQGRWVFSHTVVIKDHSDDWEEGSYDWRFLNAVIRRTYWTWGFTQRIHHFRHPKPNKKHPAGAMYWDLSGDEDNPAEYPPVPLSIGGPPTPDQRFYSKVFLDSWPENIISVAENCGLPRECFFDLKIQAAVYAMRASGDMADWLASSGMNVIELSRTNDPRDMLNYRDDVPRVRIWCRTVLLCTAKQVMPIPVLEIP